MAYGDSAWFTQQTQILSARTNAVYQTVAGTAEARARGAELLPTLVQAERIVRGSPTAPPTGVDPTVWRVFVEMTQRSRRTHDNKVGGRAPTTTAPTTTPGRPTTTAPADAGVTQVDGDRQSTGSSGRRAPAVANRDRGRQTGGTVDANRRDPPTTPTTPRTPTSPRTPNRGGGGGGGPDIPIPAAPLSIFEAFRSAGRALFPELLPGGFDTSGLPITPGMPMVDRFQIAMNFLNPVNTPMHSRPWFWPAAIITGAVVGYHFWKKYDVAELLKSESGKKQLAGAGAPKQLGPGRKRAVTVEQE